MISFVKGQQGICFFFYFKFLLNVSMYISFCQNRTIQGMTYHILVKGEVLTSHNFIKFDMQYIFYINNTYKKLYPL